MMIAWRDFLRARRLRGAAVLTAALLLVAWACHESTAQQRGFVTGVIPFAGGGAVGGVYIDAEGMLRETSTLSQSDELKHLRTGAIDSKPGAEVSSASPMRKVSLRRLEQAVAELRAAGKPLPSDVLFLAGLQAVRYVFFYPDDGDVVLAGPAEAWRQEKNGDVIGVKSRRPALQLDDLVVALRYAFTEHPQGAFIGCSIDPTEAGLKAYGNYVSGIKSMDRSQVAPIMRDMEKAMGPQEVTVLGVPPTSRFALELVAADYRLKRLALAHDPSPSKKVPNYLDLLAKSYNGGPTQQHRWWFVGNFDAIRHTPDRLAFELEGQGLRVSVAPTMFGRAANEPKPSRPATQFAEAATKSFPELAEKIPVFAGLRNLVGLAVAAEIIRQATPAAAVAEASSARSPQAPALPGGGLRGGWRPTHFLDEKACPIGEYSVPKQTPSLASVRQAKDRHWIFSVSGGVEIDPQSLADEQNWKPAGDEKLGTSRDGSAPTENASRWWWD